MDDFKKLFKVIFVKNANVIATLCASKIVKGSKFT